MVELGLQAFAAALTIRHEAEDEPRLRVVVVRNERRREGLPLARARYALDACRRKRRLAVRLQRHVNRLHADTLEREGEIVGHSLPNAHAEIALVGDARARFAAHGDTMAVIRMRI